MGCGNSKTLTMLNPGKLAGDTVKDVFNVKAGSTLDKGLTAINPADLAQTKITEPLLGYNKENVDAVASQLDPADLGTKSLVAQLKLAPDVYLANAKYQPLYADLSNDVTRRELMGADGQGGLLKLYNDISPTLSKMQAAENTALRKADIADVAALAPDAVKAWKDANPELQASMKALQDKVDASAGPSTIRDELTRQANADLLTGGRLSGEGRRQATQTVRQGAADRGMVMSNQTIFDEALNSENLRTARQDKAREFALGIDQVNAGMDQQTIGNYTTLAGMYQGQAQDPYSLVLGRSTTPQMAQNSVTQAQSMSTSPTMFDPYSSDIMSIYNANYNAQNAASLAAGNNKAANNGAMLGAGASIAGAAIIAL